MSVTSAIWAIIFCCLLRASIAGPVAAGGIRFVSSADSQALQNLFVRQKDQDGNSTSKSMPLCSPGAFDQAMNIDDTCLSCTTDTGTNQVSDCAEGCCRSFELSTDLEAAHFTTCLNGCCIRSVGILSPTSDREAGILNYDSVFLVKNDATFDEISPTGQCVTQDGPSDKCGSTCAVFTPKTTICSTATSFQVPANGESFVDPPCVGSDALAPGGDGPNGDDDDPFVDDDGGDNDDSDGDAAATGPAPEDGEPDAEDDIGLTGPADSEGGSDSDDTTKPSPDGDAEKEDDVVASPTAESDDTTGESTGSADGVPQQGEETSEEPTEEGEGDGTDEPVCFPAEATVTLQNGATKRMDEVQTGDMVLTGPGKYSMVFGFTHQVQGYRGPFVVLLTSSGAVVRLTHGHYIYANDALRRAAEVRVGEQVRLHDGGVSEIVEVGEWRGVGLFNPQTLDGDIVVDGVIISTYTDAVHVHTAHALLAPVRAFSRWGDVSAGLSRIVDRLRGSSVAAMVRS